MKVIISHDVDHLYNTDHLKDLIFPKLWVKSSIELSKHKITVREWALRMATPLKRKMHRLEELMEFDTEYGIPSTFFFGMACGLGMSYTQKIALPVIQQVRKRGFAVGVHGIAYNEVNAMKKEYDDFASLTGIKDFGIRMHYVRYDNSTFNLLANIGYLFDTSEFDTANEYTLKEPYKIGGMWEFPLCIMDAYLPYHLDDAKWRTKKYIQEAEQSKIQYLTILFHDLYYCDVYAVYRDWYVWLISYLKNRQFSFISYQDAMQELNDFVGDNI